MKTRHGRLRIIARSTLLGVLLGALAGCATTDARHDFIGEAYAARPADAPVEVFREGLPTRPYVKTARLDVHLEKSGWVTSKLEDALPELKKQARQTGSDAIIEITEKQSHYLETMMCHVTAYGVRYTDSH